MLESVFASYIFWISFVFSIGPFWLVVMESARHTKWQYLFKNYAIYQLVCWGPQIIIISIITNIIGGLHPDLLFIMHLLGGFFIFYFAYKMLQASIREGNFDFHWKRMFLISWTNPKVWTTVPIGSLSAQYTEKIWLNSLYFYFFGLPIFFIGLFFWIFLGQQSLKIAKEKFSYFYFFFISYFWYLSTL